MIRLTRIGEDPNTGASRYVDYQGRVWMRDWHEDYVYLTDERMEEEHELPMKYKACVQYTRGMTRLKEWTTIAEAEEYYGVRGGAIVAACKGRAKTCAGFIWRFRQDDQRNDRMEPR